MPAFGSIDVRALWGRAGTVSAALLASLALQAPAEAMGPGQLFDFEGPYAPANWTLTKGLGNGFVDFADLPGAITIVGSNNGFVANTDYTIELERDGHVMFLFDYSSTDSAGMDDFGYLLNGSFTQLSNSSQNNAIGSILFSVVHGDNVGFRVTTFDATSGPGRAKISVFSAPDPMAPEETPAPLPLLGAAAAFGASRKLRQRLKVASFSCSFPPDSTSA